jgi:catalase
MQFLPQQGEVNYEPNNSPTLPVEQTEYRYSQYPVSGVTQQRKVDKEDNFRQAGEFYRSLSKHDQDNLIKNLASDLGAVTNPEIRRTMVSHFYQADADYGTRLAKLVNVDVASLQRP